jgi:hypothetical protein
VGCGVATRGCSGHAGMVGWMVTGESGCSFIFILANFMNGNSVFKKNGHTST